MLHNELWAHCLLPMSHELTKCLVNATPFGNLNPSGHQRGKVSGWLTIAPLAAVQRARLPMASVVDIGELKLQDNGFPYNNDSICRVVMANHESFNVVGCL